MSLVDLGAVNYRYDTESSYEMTSPSTSNYNNTLWFLKDTQQIYKGSQCFTPGRLSGEGFAYGDPKTCQVLSAKSSAFGSGLISGAVNQDLVQFITGKYNSQDVNSLFSVGNGTSSQARSNAFTVYQDGHAEVKIQGTTGESITQKSYVDKQFEVVNTTVKLMKYDHSQSSAQVVTSDEVTLIRSGRQVMLSAEFSIPSTLLSTYSEYYISELPYHIDQSSSVLVNSDIHYIITNDDQVAQGDFVNDLCYWSRSSSSTDIHFIQDVGAVGDGRGINNQFGLISINNFVNSSFGKSYLGFTTVSSSATFAGTLYLNISYTTSETF